MWFTKIKNVELEARINAYDPVDEHNAEQLLIVGDSECDRLRRYYGVYKDDVERAEWQDDRKARYDESHKAPEQTLELIHVIEGPNGSYSTKMVEASL